jgi:transcriptional regulator GlxA family with amidase domain
VLAFPEVDDLDLMGAYAVLSKAAEIARAGPPPRWDVAIAAEQPELSTAGGLRFQAQAGLDEARQVDAVLVPGGRGIQRVLTSAPHLDYLRTAHRHGATVYSVCSGALLVAVAGIAGATTLAIHAAKHAQLAGTADCVPGAGLIRDGGLTSVGGDRRSSVKSVDLALQLVADQAPGLLPELLSRMELSQGRTLETRTPGGLARERA